MIYICITDMFLLKAWEGADSVTIFTPEIEGSSLQARVREQVSDCQVTVRKV